jgi:hypothetical protein
MEERPRAHRFANKDEPDLELKNEEGALGGLNECGGSGPRRVTRALLGIETKSRNIESSLGSKSRRYCSKQWRHMDAWGNTRTAG